MKIYSPPSFKKKEGGPNYELSKYALTLYFRLFPWREPFIVPFGTIAFKDSYYRERALTTE